MKNQPKTKLEREIKEIIAGYGCPDSYLNNEVKKFLSLFNKEKIKFALRCVGENEKHAKIKDVTDEIRNFFKDNRNKLKAEIRKRVREEGK